jgi:hypothetical protein
MLRNSAILWLCALCTLTFVGCEVRTSVVLDRGPSFLLSGSGHLVSFSVYGPQPGHKIATPLNQKGLLWRIEPISSTPQGVLVARMNLVYGRVPGGYMQTTPSVGPLSTGQVYSFAAETTGAPGASGFFYMDGNGPTLINVPGLCESAFVGDVKPVKCGTAEPYVEPSNLQEFVRENRVQK